MSRAEPGTELERQRARLYDKLAEQAHVAKQFNALLTAPDGLIENSRRTVKNLDAAVVASKRPGYFKYHEPTERVRHAEARREPEFLTRRLEELQRDIDAVSSLVCARGGLGRLRAAAAAARRRWCRRRYMRPSASVAGVAGVAGLLARRAKRLPLTPSHTPRCRATQLQADISRLEEAERRSRSASAAASGVRTSEQWLRTYGRPKAVPEGMTSSFAPVPRVYGGTEHHSAFRSSATAMRPGRCIK